MSQHDPHDAHGHGEHGATASAHAGPVEIPPEPKDRSITPAPEDFATTPPFGRLLWPLLWAAVAVGIWSAVRAIGWTAAGHATETHGPAHSEPARPH